MPPLRSFKLHGGTLVVKDTKQSALNAAAAGAVLMCICNYAVRASMPSMPSAPHGSDPCCAPAVHAP